MAPGNVIRVIVADLYPVVRAGIRYLVAQTPDLDLAAEAASESEALDVMRQLTPDVLLLSTNLSTSVCVRLTEQVFESNWGRILVLGGSPDEEPVFELLSQGVGGYLSKDESLEHLVSAIRRVARGEIGVLSTSIVARLVASDRSATVREIAEMTGREREVLHLLAQGYNNDQIARRLYLSPKTVKNHITSVYSKLGVRRRAEAVAWIWKHGLEQGR